MEELKLHFVCCPSGSNYFNKQFTVAIAILDLYSMNIKCNVKEVFAIAEQNLKVWSLTMVVISWRCSLIIETQSVIVKGARICSRKP